MASKAISFNNWGRMPPDPSRYYMRYVDFGHTILKYIACYGTGYMWKVLYDIQSRIARNFREVQIFAIFATHDQNAKIRTVK